MTENQSQIESLKSAIQALEAQRPVLGEAVVEAALAPLRQKLAALQGGAAEQRKQVTVLFADLAGFTALSAGMDPEDVREVMNAYFQRWSGCIQSQAGVVEKFIGDAVLAVFGLPASHEDDAERAIRAALAMQAELGGLNTRLEAERGLRLQMRVGIHTGEVVVSLMGERQGEEFIVVGEVVNLASRLQGAAPAGGILITQDTYRFVRGLFETSPYGPLELKGIPGPVQAYQVRAAKPHAFRLDSRGVEGVETRLVGRAAELQRLQDAFRQTLASGERRLVSVVGEAGLGKTRLLSEFENWLELLPERIYYFRSRAHPSTQNIPYSLLRDGFAFRCQIQDSDPPATVGDKLRRNAVRVWGDEPAARMKMMVIARLLGFEIGESQEPEAENDAKALHDRALVYLMDYFRAMAAAGPVLLLFEDLHWADDSALDLVSYLENVLGRLPLLIVAAARPSLFERRPGWGAGLSFHTRLDLSPLDEAAASDLVRQILHKVDPLPPTLVNLVVRTAEGNPFYIEELIKMLIEDGVIRKGAERWQVEEAHLGALRVPPTLMGVLQARFDSLEPQQRGCLQRGAVIGRIFWDQAVQALAAPSPAGQTEREVFDSLSRKEMIFRQEPSSFENTAEYLFKHALLRDVTYSSLLRRERKAFHRLAARWLEEATGRTRRSAEFAMPIAEHYEQAGLNGQAAEWYLRAARTASARYASSEALRAFNRALELSPDADPRWKFSLLLGREKVYDLLGRREEQLSDLEEIRRTAEALGEASLLAQALLRRAQYDSLTSDYPSSIEHARQAAELVGEQDRELAARSALLLAAAFMRQGSLDMAERYALDALERSTEAGSADLQAESYRQIGLVTYYSGNPQLSGQHFAEALHFFQQAGNRSGEALALNNLGGAAFDGGNYPQASDFYLRSLHLCREIGDRLGEGRALNNLGISSVTQGNLAQAEEYYRQALQISRDVGQRAFESSALDNLGNLASSRYHYTEALEYQSQALEGARQLGDRVSESFALINLSRIYLLLGAFDQAGELIEKSVEVNRQVGDQQGLCHALVSLSQYQQAVGERTAALLTLQEALHITAENHLRSEQSWVLHVRGAVLVDLRDFAAAVEAYRQALEVRRELEEADEAIETLAGLGSALLALGDLDQARLCAEEVYQRLTGSPVEGFEQPIQVFLACYRILAEAADPRAGEILRRGHDLLLEIATRIEDEDLRRGYLSRLAENRALVAAWDGTNHLPPGSGA